MDATVLSNLQPALRQLVREEIWQAQSRPDVLQDLFLALLEHGDGITHPLAWAKRWLRNRRIDRWRRESSKAVQFQSLTTEHDAGSSDESPLDAMIDAESQQQAADNRRRLHDAIPRLPRCQREAMALEIDPARQSSAIEAKPPGKSHRSNVYKATKSLKTLLAGDEAQDVRVAAPEPGCATSRHRPALSTRPSEPSMARVALSTKKKEGTARAEGMSTATVDPLKGIVQPSTSLAEPRQRPQAHQRPASTDQRRLYIEAKLPTSHRGCGSDRSRAQLSPRIAC